MSGLPPISMLETSGVVDVVFNADQTRVYVALGNGTIELFDLATQAKLGSWQVSSALNSISLSEDGTFLLATNPNLPVVLRVASDTGQVITSYSSTGSAFRDVEVVDSRTAVITGGQVLSLDLVTGVMTPLANAAYYSSNSILSEDGHLTLLGEKGISNGPLAIYDDRVGAIVARGDNYQTIGQSNATGFNFGIQAISENAGIVLQFIYPNSMNIYDLSLKFVRTVSLDRTANGIAFDQTGRFVYIHLLGDNNTAAVAKYEIATWTEVERYPLAAGSDWAGDQFNTGNQLQVTDNGNFLTVFDSSGKLQLVDLRATDDAITGTANSDRLFGGAGADVIHGEGGNDVLGSAGMLPNSSAQQVPGLDLGQERDQLFGGDGDDLIGAGYGDDVNGGSGIDTLRLSLAGSTAGLTLDTAAFVSGSPISIGGGTISGVEALEYLRGSDFSDVITIASQTLTVTVDSAGGNDVVTASGGAVIFRGGLGNDLFVTGSGLETFDGGEGEDTIDYRNAGAGVEVRLNAAPGGSAIGPGGDSIVNVEGINGSEFNDRLFGSNAANRIDGAAGDDEIDGGLGNDTLIGGTGTDTITYASATSGVTVNLGAVGAQTTIGAGIDTLSGFEVLIGSEFGDRLTAGLGYSNIYGGGGNDTLTPSVDGDRLHGGTGNDTFISGVGDDEFVGGEGFDTVDYSAASGGVKAGSFYRGANGVDMLTGIERIIGSNFDDELANTSVMIGGAGNDVYIVYSGQQVVEAAGQGNDTVHSYVDYTLPENVENLLLRFDPYAGASVAPEAALNGTGNSLSNIIMGSGGANLLSGMVGADTLTGGAGLDTLTGGEGNDTFLDTKAGLNGDRLEDFTFGDRIVITDATLANFTFQLSGSTLTYTGGSLTFGSAINGPIVAIAAEGGGVVLTISKQFAGPEGALVSNFAVGAGGWSSQDLYPRHIADVNGDGFSDIVGFGQAGVLVSFGSANGSFTSAGLAVANFGHTAGWTSDNRFHRELADVNGDGRADIVGFGIAGTLVSFAKADGTFSDPFTGVANFGTNQGWATQDGFARAVGDVNGDGKADLIGFGYAGTLVSIGNGDGTFQGTRLALANFGVEQGWTSDDLFHRMVADVNGDGADDIIGFGYAGTLVALSKGDGTFQAAQLALENFGKNQGWSAQDRFARDAADVNGDGYADVVGFGIAGTFVAYGQANGTFTPAKLDVNNFGANQGWTSDNTYRRELADINNDGTIDIVGFGFAGVLAGYNQGHWLA